jgi:hypothetical protein
LHHVAYDKYFDKCLPEAGLNLGACDVNPG